MKKLMMIAAMMLMSVGAFAQEAGEMYIKPMVGGTMATVTNSDHAKFKLGFVGGAEFGYNIADAFAVTAGALFTMQGAKSEDTNHTKDASTTTTYINVPIMANYYIAPGFAIKAGVQPGFLISAKNKESKNINGTWVDYDRSGTDELKKVDFSIPVGLSYEFSDFVIDARYNIGLTNIIDSALSDLTDTKIKNSVIMLTIGYKIPL